jgi:hypothetical protein
LPLFPAAGLAFSGATLVFLVPAFLMLAGAASMAGKPDSARMSLGNVLAGGAIVTLLLVGGWSVLIGMTVAGCYPIPGGEACSDHYISTNGLLVGGICVVGALAIAVVGAGLPKMLGRAGR